VLRLFLREGCHLCDEALELLQSQSITAEMVDIEDDLELQLRYGLRIPVLNRGDAHSELDWPFDLTGLQLWLQSTRA
jgi:hypothetical protein